LVIHSQEAPVRRKAYELFLQHRRKGTVAKLLNASGYRTRGNVIWRDTNIYRILTDTSAKGVYYFNRFRQTGTWRTELKPENEWGKVECEAIVPETLWNQVNQIIEEQLKSWKRPGKAPVHVFGSLLHCACGHKMYMRSKYPKYSCRKCHNKISISDLEEIFHKEMKAFFAQPERISATRATHIQYCPGQPRASLAA
jgi:site-specific DNA recombinase